MNLWFFETLKYIFSFQIMLSLWSIDFLQNHDIIGNSFINSSLLIKLKEKVFLIDIFKCIIFYVEYLIFSIKYIWRFNDVWFFWF
jgi:hypothetical protein